MGLQWVKQTAPLGWVGLRKKNSSCTVNGQHFETDSLLKTGIYIPKRDICHFEHMCAVFVRRLS